MCYRLLSKPQNRSVNLLLTDNCGRFVSVCVTKIIGQFGMITPRSCGFSQATPPCTAFSCRAIESVFTNFGFFISPQALTVRVNIFLETLKIFVGCI